MTHMGLQIVGWFVYDVLYTPRKDRFLHHTQVLLFSLYARRSTLPRKSWVATTPILTLLVAPAVIAMTTTADAINDEENAITATLDIQEISLCCM